MAAGCGGSPSVRERVAAYLGDAAGVQTRWSRAFETANRAYADFAAGRLQGEAATRQLAKSRDDVQALRDALAALSPPGEARALHAKMLRVFDLDLALATENAQLAAYVPAESAVLDRLPAANRQLRRRLAAASRDPVAQARALGAFQITLDGTVDDLRTLDPPPVLRVGHGDRIHAPWPVPPRCQDACGPRCAPATPCAPRACSTSSNAHRLTVARSHAKRSRPIAVARCR